MSELPYTTGLTDEFTTLVPTSVSASEWVNQKGTTNFVLQNAEFADSTISLTGNNVAWLPIAEPTEYTAYILCKTYIPTPRSSAYAQIFGCINVSNRCSVYISNGTDTSKIYKLRTYTSSTYVNPTMDNWHVITVKRTGGYYYVYADGELIISEANTATTRGDKFMIKSISDVGSTPTVDEAITVYLKYCAIFNVVQTDRQIIENTNQILVDFGIKLPPHNTRLAGTDAVAIAYAIARNQESAAALQQLKKAYQDGMLDGDGDTTPSFETDDTDPIINTDPINDKDRGESDDGTVINLSKGIMAIYEKPDDPTDTVTVKVTMKHDKDTTTHYGYIYVETYDSTGKELGAQQHSFLTFQGNQVYHLSKSSSSTQYFTKYACHFYNGSGYISGYYVHSNSDEGSWTGGSSYISNPQWSIPSGYVYVGCKNI